ncbi:hypothetical protein BaRGS_00015245 [Batillaria attramentaria]|uniref:lysoplasmalogenase n=1 Tax=Batillaria attramentaria TaxID=370345 RepID=A0ABD0L293_9CAEN|nr:hypothetical protein BaRGS_024279 [Batillaria attramentaria]
MTPQDPRLYPFFVLVVVYFITYQPFLHYPPHTVMAAATKAAPIWYLAGYVFKASENPDLTWQERTLSCWSVVGLLLSSVGDVCLVWRDTLFIPGMLFFGLAQAAYIVGLKAAITPLGKAQKDYADLFVLLWACSYLFIASGMDSWFMAGIVLVYAALLFTMGFMSLRRHLGEGSEASLHGAVGGLLFMTSDLLIAVDKWRFHVLFSELVIMVTYYAAQYGLAVAASNFGRAREKRID